MPADIELSSSQQIEFESGLSTKDRQLSAVEGQCLGHNISCVHVVSDFPPSSLDSSSQLNQCTLTKSEGPGADIESKFVQGQPPESCDGGQLIELQQRSTNLNTLNADSKGIKYEIKCIVEEHFQISTSSEQRYRGKQNSLLEQAISQGTAGSVWDTSHPVAANLCKPWTVHLILMCAVFLFLSLVANIIRDWQNNVSYAYQFRFNVLSTRNNNASTASFQSPPISKMGLLMNVCEVDLSSLPCTTFIGNQSSMISCSVPVSMNGWWFMTASENPENDPVRFYLEGCSVLEGPTAAECAWNKIGSSTWIWLWWGLPYFTDGIYSTSFQRLHIEAFDTSLPWVLSASILLSCVVLVAICLILLIALHNKERMIGVQIASGGCFSACIAQLLSCIGFILIGQYAAAFFSAGTCLVYFGLAFVMAYAQSFLRHFLGIAGLGLIIVRIIHDKVFISEIDMSLDISLAAFENPYSMTFVPLVMSSIIAYLTRRESRRRAARVIADDWNKYECCWTRLLQDTEEKKNIQCLCEYVKKLHTEQTLGSAPLRQRFKKSLTPGLSDSYGQDVVIEMEEKSGHLVQDLDQLFAQARGLYPFLRAQTCQWAAASDAYLPVERSSGCQLEYLQWSELEKSPILLQSVRWAKLKARQRAVEKLFRCYAFDVSRLLDCCRQSLYFDRVDRLLKCLQAIHQDHAVQVLRVHNKLRPTYNAATTAGYRDVLVNLLLTTEGTKRLGVENHVCEVQLVLIDFAKTKVKMSSPAYTNYLELF